MFAWLHSLFHEEPAPSGASIDDARSRAATFGAFEPSDEPEVMRVDREIQRLYARRRDLLGEVEDIDVAIEALVAQRQLMTSGDAI